MSLPLVNVPCINQFLKVLEQDFTEFPLIPWAGSEGIRLLNVELLREEPILAHATSFLAVNMNRFIALVGEKEDSPAFNRQN